MVEVTANRNGRNMYRIPITWEVYDTLNVQANSLDEALEFANTNIGILPLGDDPIYVEASYKIDCDAAHCLQKGLVCDEFSCEEDLSAFTDSMLFDSGTDIAYARFSYGARHLDAFLIVSGSVKVEYLGEIYHAPSEFPEELRKLIQDSPKDWMFSPDIYVGLNNWFECILAGTGEGFVYESDVSGSTPEDILDFMTEAACS